MALVALMEDQVNRLNGVAGLRVEYKGYSAEGDERIKAGDIIFVSPEALVGDPQRRSYIQKLNVGLLVIDEFHTIGVVMKPMKKKLFSEDGFAMLGNFAPYTHLPPFWR